MPLRPLLRLALPVLGATAALGACTAYQPVHEVFNHPLPAMATRMGMGPDEVGQILQTTASQTGWQVTIIPHLAELRLHRGDRDRYADAVLRYTDTTYTILYAGSNMLRPNHDIESAYNSWVRALEANIDKRLILAGKARSGIPRLPAQVDPAMMPEPMPASPADPR